MDSNTPVQGDKDLLRTARRMQLAAYRVEAAAGDPMAPAMVRAFELLLGAEGDEEDDER
jgi:hypothetical protein